MKQAVQKRTLKTRARMIQAAQALIQEAGYEALRVEDVVRKAGVAKGTFFAHFKDKDALMDFLIGDKIDSFLDEIETLPTPKDVTAMVDAMAPMLAFLTSERYIFDVVLRHSTAGLNQEVGPIATTFGRHAEVITHWIADGPFRKDITSELLAEGVQAFFIQVIALEFCTLHNMTGKTTRFRTYLEAWLNPTTAPGPAA